MKQSTFHIALLCLRIIGGGLMLTHGIPKLIRVFQGDTSFADPINIGAIPSLILTISAEVICAILVLIGFKTRYAAIPLAITMCVAAFVVHGPDPLAKKELALLYLGIFVALALMGGGKYAVKE